MSAIAKLTFEDVTGTRGIMNVFGNDKTLDGNIVDAIGTLRAAGRKMVKTEMTINGEEWVYEYDSTGHVERTFMNGAVTP
jgi:hypothetical protein